MLCVPWGIEYIDLFGAEPKFCAFFDRNDLLFANRTRCSPKITQFIPVDPCRTGDELRRVNKVGRSFGVDIYSCSELVRPSPGASGVIEVDMRSEEVANMSGIEPELSNPFNDILKYRFRAAVDQHQFRRSALDECNADNMRCSEVKGVDEVNHSK